MTDLISIKRKVQEEEVAYRAAVSESTWSKIGSAINFLIDNATFAVGDLMWSMLDEATFQAERNTQWVLCDGRSVLGTDYQTLTGNNNIPDLRGRFVRMKNNGASVNPDGDVALGTLQGQQYLSHRHVGADEYFSRPLVSGADSSAVSDPSTREFFDTGLHEARRFAPIYIVAPTENTGSYDWCEAVAWKRTQTLDGFLDTGINPVNYQIPQRYFDNDGFTGVRSKASGGNETRPVNATFNAFIKINN